MQGYPPPGYGPPRGWSAPGYAPQQPAGFLPPAPYGYDPRAPYGIHPRLGLPYSHREKVVAGVLQIFLGKFGVGRFYTGHTGMAVAQLVTCMLGVWVFSWFTCGLTVFVLLWPLIDGIVILASDSVDGNGLPLR